MRRSTQALRGVGSAPSGASGPRVSYRSIDERPSSSHTRRFGTLRRSAPWTTSVWTRSLRGRPEESNDDDSEIGDDDAGGGFVLMTAFLRRYDPDQVRGVHLSRREA